MSLLFLGTFLLGLVSCGCGYGVYRYQRLQQLNRRLLTVASSRKVHLDQSAQVTQLWVHQYRGQVGVLANRVFDLLSDLESCSVRVHLSHGGLLHPYTITLAGLAQHVAGDAANFLRSAGTPEDRVSVTFSVWECVQPVVHIRYVPMLLDPENPGKELIQIDAQLVSALRETELVVEGDECRQKK